METNVVSLSEFKHRKTINSIQTASNGQEALAIDEFTTDSEMLEMLKERLFSLIPEYRFVTEEGIWDGEYEDSEPYTIRVRLKGTDFSGYGHNIDSAWYRMSATLIEEELV